MDVAYDHIQEESFPDDEGRKEEGDTATDSTQQPASTFNSEVQEAYKAISSSPWAARIGGFWGSVKKQGESYYEGARQEYSPAISQATSQATNTLSGLRSSILDRTRNLSISQQEPQEAGFGTDAAKRTITDKEGNTIEVATPSNGPSGTPAVDAERAESLPADIVKEAESMLSRLRLEGAKRLKEIQKAEDAADEALLKFGTNIRNFLRDAVTIAPPDENDPNSSGSSTGTGSNKVLFESKDASGKRVIHTTRLDAQLHVIHSSLESFEKDPESSPEWDAWNKSFDISKKTEDISKDLEQYEELRRAMEVLVPEKVAYPEFWQRYYFLRHVVESEDQRRREMLKASTTSVNEEISWDDDSDDESTTPNPADPAKPSLANSKETLKPDAAATPATPATPTPSSQQPTTEPQPPTSTPSSTAPTPTTTASNLKPTPSPQGTRSHDERSVTDSDASYDVVSGATSRGAGSPVGKRVEEAKAEEGKGKEEESDDDWE